MAIIRTKNFTAQAPKGNIDLLDTPERLLSFAQRNNIKVSPYVDVEAIAKALGISVRYEALANDFSGTLKKNASENNWIITVEKRHHKNRQRYTIAHELAHFCLHRHLKDHFEDLVFFRGGDISKEEFQANDFASAILMPEDAFREKISSGKTSIEDLSKDFNVSSLALRIRAKTLGMKGHGL